MSRQKHIHKYKKIKLGKDYIVFRCLLPDCSHYIRRELAEGKVSICNRCNQPFIMTKNVVRKHAMPHCDDCVVRRDEQKISSIKELLEAKDVHD